MHKPIAILTRFQSYLFVKNYQNAILHLIIQSSVLQRDPS